MRWDLVHDGDELTPAQIEGLTGAAAALASFGAGTVTLTGRTNAGRMVTAVSVARIAGQLVGVVVDARSTDGDVVWAVADRGATDA